MRKRGIFPSLLERSNVLEDTDAAVRNTIGLELRRRGWVKEVFVKIAEFEVHRFESRLRESCADLIDTGRRPVTVSSHIEGMKKGTKAVKVRPGNGWKTEMVTREIILEKVAE